MRHTVSEVYVPWLTTGVTGFVDLVFRPQRATESTGALPVFLFGLEDFCYGEVVRTFMVKAHIRRAPGTKVHQCMRRPAQVLQ